MVVEAQAVGDGGAASIALRARAMAARELGDLHAAEADLREAIDVAEGAELARAAGLARGTLASVLGAGGQLATALDQLERAAPQLAGADLALVEMQRGDLLARVGRREEAADAFDRALEGARAAGDASSEAFVRANRALLSVERDRLTEADDDLARAEALLVEAGMDLLAADVHHNRGFVAGRGGDVVAALRRFEEARAEHERLGVRRVGGWLDECEVLLSVHLAPEARALASRARAELAAAGQHTDAAEADLLLGRSAALDGDLEAALAAYGRARSAFEAQGRAVWAVRAEAAALQVQALTPRPPTAEEASALAARLADLGWTADAVEASLLAGRLAVAAGEPGRAEADLARAASGRDHPLARVRIAAHHAAAIEASIRGDGAAARQALAAGLDDAAAAAAALGATELRTSSSAAAEGLATAGVALAVAGGDAVDVLQWSERWRALALSYVPVRPPADDELAAELAALRRVVRRVDDALLTEADAADAVAEQGRIERRVDRRVRLLRGSAGGRPGAVDAEALRKALGDRELVTFVEHDRRIVAVHLDAATTSSRDVGPAAGIDDAVRALRFSLGRALRPANPSRAAWALAVVDEQARDLDRRLLGGAGAGAGGPLVVVPTGALHALPWSVLPSLRGRPVSVAPSAGAWLRAAGRRDDGAPPGVLALAGPAVEGADDELAGVVAAHGGGTVLEGEAASVTAVLSSLPSVGVAHLAAHGRFRDDSPMFSSLDLADGPLTIHDLERLAAVPHLVVLSACDVGRSLVRPGNEVVGVVAAFLHLGSAALVASVVPVPHDVATRVTVAFHHALAAGRTPAEALATVAPREPLVPFVCFGAG